MQLNFVLIQRLVEYNAPNWHDVDDLQWLAATFDNIYVEPLDSWYAAAQRAFANGANVVCFLDIGELGHSVAEAPAWRAIAQRALDENRTAVFMPHTEHATVPDVTLPAIIRTCRTYRLRMFVREVPQCLLWFVGPGRDASLLQGALAYRGLLVENVETYDTLPRSDRVTWDNVADSMFTRVPATLSDRVAHTLVDFAAAQTAVSTAYKAMMVTTAQSMCAAPEIILKAEEVVERDGITVLEAHQRYMRFFAWDPVWFAKRLMFAQSKYTGFCAQRAFQLFANQLGFDIELHDGAAAQALTEVTAAVALTAPAIAQQASAALIACGAFTFTPIDQQAPTHVIADAKTHDPRHSTILVFDTIPARGDFHAVTAILCARCIVVFSEAQRIAFLRVFSLFDKVHVVRLSATPYATPVTKLPFHVFIEAGTNLQLCEALRVRLPQIVFVTEPAQLGSCVLYIDAQLNECAPAAWTPLRLLEAQVNGIIPVCVGVGAIPEYIKFGFFYKTPATAAACVSAMVTRCAALLEDDGARQALLDNLPNMTALHPDITLWSWRALFCASDGYAGS